MMIMMIDTDDTFPIQEIDSFLPFPDTFGKGLEVGRLKVGLLEGLIEGQMARKLCEGLEVEKLEGQKAERLEGWKERCLEGWKFTC